MSKYRNTSSARCAILFENGKNNYSYFYGDKYSNDKYAINRTSSNECIKYMCGNNQRCGCNKCSEYRILSEYRNFAKIIW